MAHGAIDVETYIPIDFSSLKKTAVKLEEEYLLAKARRRAAKYLQDVRRKRTKILQRAERLGFQSGTVKGRKEAEKQFNRTSQESRNFKRQLEQQFLMIAHEVFLAVASENSSVLNSMTKLALQSLQHRLRAVSLIEVVIHPIIKKEVFAFLRAQKVRIPIRTNTTTPSTKVLFFAVNGSFEIDVIDLFETKISVAMNRLALKDDKTSPELLMP